MEIERKRVAVPVTGAERPMHAYLAAPTAGGPYPGVVVLCDVFGVTRHIREVTERIAMEGYAVIAPNLHHRDAHGQELGYTDEETSAGRELAGRLTAAGIDADCAAALAVLDDRQYSTGKAVGCVGFGAGGDAAFLAACTLGVRATASFYGEGIAHGALGGDAPTLSRAPGIAERFGKILCIFGEADELVPAADVEEIRAALVAAGARHEIATYPGAGHGFFCDRRDTYDEAAATDAWMRVKSLFARELAE